MILDEIDKPGMKRPETLREHLRNHLGRVYRYHMDKGLSIIITTENETSTDPIPIRDPIFQIKSSAEVNTFGTQDVEGVVEIVLDGRDAKTLPEIIDPDTGEPAIIKIKLVGVSPKAALDFGGSTIKGGLPSNGDSTMTARDSASSGTAEKSNQPRPWISSRKLTIKTTSEEK